MKLSELARNSVHSFKLMGFCLLVCDAMSFGKIFWPPHKTVVMEPVVSTRYLATLKVKKLLASSCHSVRHCAWNKQ